MAYGIQYECEFKMTVLWRVCEGVMNYEVRPHVLG